MATGTAKWFNDAKGFSFDPDDGGEDLFVHFSGIAMPGFKEALAEGQRVPFEVIEGPKGKQASATSWRSSRTGSAAEPGVTLPGIAGRICPAQIRANDPAVAGPARTRLEILGDGVSDAAAKLCSFRA